MKLILACFGLITSFSGVYGSAPAYVVIESLEVNGTGCPKGSVQRSISGDRRSFTLFFNEYLAEIGAGTSLRDQRKSCQITVNLATPGGWRFAVSRFTYRGFADLDKGIEGSHDTNYYFQGEIDGGSFQHVMQGPRNFGFDFTDSVPTAEEVWSSCSQKRALNIQTVMKLSNTNKAAFPNASGAMGTDALDGTIGEQRWDIKWESCNP
ncbi:DUF4360 domain-containing protein [Pseudobacteriovorax antillogorgiicola]|uniref:DUF4360 domain-containing protein n=1 Tax=Pseudobacteriovorax antillogorgiicola TaxID=1513793 RepID=A0A1Y6CP87_9BACT|nr:DUF4360 domain-containing protein [Pseudobacteriovorax antillogorgiicola]TCS43646.1 uncharacterized protein DUF4360 [Pseudobacteriovorax antillogorgiicola]SMF79928.1 protein of unknown function [Pseudobacteriovorax antillogorgiicola]